MQPVCTPNGLSSEVPNPTTNVSAQVDLGSLIALDVAHLETVPLASFARAMFSLLDMLDSLDAKTSLVSWNLWLVLAPLALYSLLVSALRHQRRKSIERRYNYPHRASFAKMTVDEAWAIATSLVELEFPTVFSTATFFALFKVCH